MAKDNPDDERAVSEFLSSPAGTWISRLLILVLVIGLAYTAVAPFFTQN